LTPVDLTDQLDGRREESVRSPWRHSCYEGFIGNESQSREIVGRDHQLATRISLSSRHVRRTNMDTQSDSDDVLHAWRLLSIDCHAAIGVGTPAFVVRPLIKDFPLVAF
jgi:hypothetical protein